MFWGPDPEEQRKQQEAEYVQAAFSSPSRLAKRIGPRSPVISRNNSTDGEMSVSSRRTPSIITTEEDRKMFEKHFGSTGVVLKKPLSPEGSTVVVGGPLGNSASLHRKQAPSDLSTPALDHPESSTTFPSLPGQLTSGYRPTTLNATLDRADAAVANAHSVVRSKDSSYTTSHDTTSYTGTVPDGATTIKTNDVSTIKTRESSNEQSKGGSLPSWANNSIVDSHYRAAPSGSDDGGMQPTPVAPRGTGNSAGTPRSLTLDLRHNDSQFQIIASLIVNKFDSQLKSGAPAFVLSTEDKQQIERTVPLRQRENFIDAVRMRLQSCPPDSDRPIHVVARKCRILGLDRDGNQNLLFARAGSIITLNVENLEIQRQLDQMKEEVSQMSEPDGNPENMARQQLLAELREASNLMAESVTPEAAQFWRKHVVELQARLRALHDKSGGVTVRSSGGDAEDIMRNNERLMASLQENTGYKPPTKEELQQSNASNANNANNSSTAITSRGLPMQQQEYASGSRAMGHNDTNQVIDQNIDPSMQGLPMVDVVAPGDLPGGYTFEAEINNKRFIATVPNGGVRKGETFSCFMRGLEDFNSEIPIGRWRDTICGCCNVGCCHPLCLNALFCPLFALAQIMTRMGFDFMGWPAEDVPKKGCWSTCGMMSMIVLFWLFLNGVVLGGMGYKLYNELSVSTADISALTMVNFAIIAFTVYATAATRGSIREKFMIRENYCVDSEDCCCAVFCLPCAICQMGRHTADFDKTPGACCTNSGLVETV